MLTAMPSTCIRRVAALALAAAVLCVPASAQAPSPSRSEPRAEVLALFQQSARDWSRGDIDAFCAVYADDALFVSPTGITRGRQAVLERYKQRYAGTAAMGTLSFEVLEVRVAPGESAVSLAARWHLTYADKPAASGLTLTVWHRTPAGWRLVQDASM
jgi:uncharacterized protein (TIGR02246 family)